MIAPPGPGPSIDRAADAIIALAEQRAALLDATAEVIERRTDLAIAEYARRRIAAELVGLEEAAGAGGRGRAELARLLASPNARALRAAARRYRAPATSRPP